MKQKWPLLYISYAVVKVLLVLSFLFVPAQATGNIYAKWNFLVYIAANNNLYRYGQYNIKEMQQIGSNENINIFVQLDNFGKKQVTRYKVEKGKSTVISTVTNPPIGVSGTPENLYDFVREITQKYRSEKLALILWNHGSGAKDPHLWGRVLPYVREHAFRFNQETQLYEIDRNIVNLRGIAFNDIAHTFISNPELKIALERISRELLGGKKIDLLGMDACHMAMIEIASQAKNAANLLVGSEEIEPGPGWDYAGLLSPFKTRNLSPEEFAQQIVSIYGAKYNRLFADLTQSAINLKNHSIIESNLDTVATLLISLISELKNATILNIIHHIRKDPRQTTSFLDADYIDLIHFYKSLHMQLINMQLPSDTHQAKIITSLKATLEQGIKLISSQIIHNATGQNAKNAHGLSIYFPTRTLHASYLKNTITQTTNWGNFIYTYLKERQAKLAQPNP